MSTWLPMSDSPLPPLIGGPTSNCRSNLWMDVHASPFCRSNLWMDVPPPNGNPSSEWRSHLNHPTSVPIPWLECLHASVHVCMSTWLSISPQSPMHIYMETLLLLYGTVFVSHPTHLCSHTLFRMFACISPCTYVQPTPHVSSTPFG